MTLDKRWIIPAPLTPEADTALGAFPQPLRQILFNRGFATEASARAYLNAQVDFNTDPFQMTGMDQAVDRIRSAI